MAGGTLALQVSRNAMVMAWAKNKKERKTKKSSVGEPEPGELRSDIGQKLKDLTGQRESTRKTRRGKGDTGIPS